jgi:hypothetical protein
MCRPHHLTANDVTGILIFNTHKKTMLDASQIVFENPKLPSGINVTGSVASYHNLTKIALCGPISGPNTTVRFSGDEQ